MSLTLADLCVVVETAPAIRLVQELQPAGGTGATVFPPTFGEVKTPGGGDGRERATKHAFENRMVEGVERRCVLLDSVASQANRLEASLKAARNADAAVPLIEVDFTGTEVGNVGTITSADAPHRGFDAIFRDSRLDGTPFPQTAVFKALAQARLDSATALLDISPHMAVFGAWNSSGEHGGAGTKFPRALSSEIVGLDAIPWIKAGSRIDPLAIPSGAEIYEPLDDSIRYTSDPEEARRDKSGKPIPLVAKGGKAGRPALVNHGNVLPSTSSGGVTISKAIQTTLLSLAQLRKLSFPKPDGSRDGDLAARTALAALALVAIAWQMREGYALRSRCDLVPATDPEFEIVHTATRTTRFTLDPLEAIALLSDAVTALRDTGLTWGNQAVRLTPDPRLIKLIIKGRELADIGQDESTDAS